MTIRKMPKAKVFDRPKNYQPEPPSDVFAKWAKSPLLAEADDPNTITIYDVIGYDFWTGEGFTAKRMSAALRRIGSNPVTVKINSPGGDMFEGITIYNQLQQHPAKVTIDVMGWSASAASVIQMAGDEIRMGLGTFTMVHNAWGLVIGNQHDMADASKLFAGFDSAIADIYEARTGLKRADIEALMDAETFMGPSEAIDKGFADSVLDEDPAEEAAAANNGAVDRALLARRQVEAALATAGIPRNQRSKMIADLADIVRPDGARDAAAGGAEIVTQLRQLVGDIKAAI